MAKFYIKSGPVQLILEADNPLQAAVRAFQWTCDRQATIDVDCPLAHIQEAESRGWQMHEEILVSERGFDSLDAVALDTLLVVAAWQEQDEHLRMPGEVLAPLARLPR